MERTVHAARAEHFRALHAGGRLLLLPNAWDAVSARLFEEQGFSAIATTSAGVASAMGFPDGEFMPLETHLAVARCMVEHVRIPVSLDMERGYARTPTELYGNVIRVLEAGIVGVNLEDGLGEDGGHSSGPRLRDVDEQCERIMSAREAAGHYGVPLVINARTDALLGNDAGPNAVSEAIRRGNRYREAGADCVFVPDLETLEEPGMTLLATDLDAPLNLIAGRRTPPVSRLQEIGVARLSFGPRPMRAILSALQTMAREWLDTGTWARMSEGTLGYDTVNAWFAR